MNTIVVWVLVTIGGYGNNQLVYSPHLADQATCEHLQKSINKVQRLSISDTRCVQLRVPK